VIKMYDKIIKKLEERIKELEEMNAALAKKVDILNADLNALEDDIIIGAKIARAVCEIQEHLRDNDPSFMMINRIHAPTMVGMR